MLPSNLQMLCSACYSNNVLIRKKRKIFSSGPRLNSDSQLAFSSAANLVSLNWNRFLAWLCLNLNIFEYTRQLFLKCYSILDLSGCFFDRRVLKTYTDELKCRPKPRQKPRVKVLTLNHADVQPKLVYWF